MDQEQFEKTRAREGDLVMVISKLAGTGERRTQFRVGIMGESHRWGGTEPSFTVYPGVYPDSGNPNRDNSDPYSPIRVGEATYMIKDCEMLRVLCKKEALPRLVEKYRAQK